MRRVGALLALAVAARAQDVPRPTRLRIYEVRTALRFDEGELQRVNFRSAPSAPESRDSSPTHLRLCTANGLPGSSRKPVSHYVRQRSRA